MRILSIFFALVLISCVPKEIYIEDRDVTAAVEGLFSALDVENDDPNLMDQFVTEDFLIYEAGKKMTREEFKEFVSGMPVTKSDWVLSDYRISIDRNSAHVSLLNNGIFEFEVDTLQLRRKYTWLESAYLVKEKDSLKIKFYFSDNVYMTTDTIN